MAFELSSVRNLKPIVFISFLAAAALLMWLDSQAIDASDKVVHAHPATAYSVVAFLYAAAMASPLFFSRLRRLVVKDQGQFESTKWYMIFLAIMFLFAALAMALKARIDLASHV